MRIPFPPGRLPAAPFLSLLLLQIACNPLDLKGKKSSSGGDSWDVTSMSIGKPLSYPLTDPDCQSTEGDGDVGIKPFSIWNGGEVKDESSEIPGLSGYRSASSRSIRQTYYGFHQKTKTVCRMKGEDDVTCDDPERTTVSDAKLLKLCKGTKSYGRRSLEGATLSTLANLERARSHYEKLSLKSPRYSSASLLMMPNYEEVIDVYHLSKEKRYVVRGSDTDNAGFAVIKSDGSVAQIFVVFPKSVEKDEKPEWSKINLWEVPWIMAHEFGHQTFYTHYMHYLEDSGSSGLSFEHGNGVWDERKDLKDALPHRKSTGFGLVGYRKVNLKTTLHALNEGFADLFGAYATGRSDFAKGLPCFETTRDFRSAYFADGKPKRLTDDVLAIYFSTDEEETPDDCKTTYFQDSHHIGAIIAHGLSRLFDARAGESATPEEKSELLLEWLNRLDALRTKEFGYLDHRELMGLGIQAAIEVANGSTESTTRTVSTEICAIAKEVFPAYTKTLFNDEGAYYGAPFICADPDAEEPAEEIEE